MVCPIIRRKYYVGETGKSMTGVELRGGVGVSYGSAIQPIDAAPANTAPPIRSALR